jgi:hypothetical protein
MDAREFNYLTQELQRSVDMADRRSSRSLAAFAAPCPLAALGLPLVVYLPEFYVSELGLSLARWARRS